MKKVIVLIDSSSTHNFTHYKLGKILNLFMYLEPKFQLMSVDGGTIHCLMKCQNINLNTGEYVLNNLMVVIQMCVSNVVLGV